MKRFSLLLVGMVLFGAGCFSNPALTPQDQTPQPAATSTSQATAPTPEAIPGTENWLDYENFAYGFGFNYPPEAINRFRIDEATGTVLTLDLGPTVVSTTAVSVPTATLDVKIMAQDGQGLAPGANLKDGCYDELGGQAQVVPRVNYGGQDVCVTSGSDAGAGNYYNSYWYTVPLKDKYLVLAYTVHSVNCGNYDKPEQCIAFDESRDSLTSKLVMSTLNMFEPSVEAARSNVRFETKSTGQTDKLKEIDFKYPVMTGGDQGSAGAFNDAIQAYVSTTTDGFLQVVKESADYPGPGPFVLQSSYSIPFVSDKLVEVIFEGYEFTGGAHGMTIYRTFVFDAATGKELALADFFTDDAAAMQAVADYSAQDLARRDVSDADWIKGGTAPDTANYRFFYWTKDGLAIIFPPYQVAAYAAGPQTVVVPYGKLSDVMEPVIKQGLGL